jgi:hypothetical protein
MNYSQRAILSALNAPIKKAPRVELGWFVPNSAELRAQMRFHQKQPGKRITLEALDNGPVKFFVEDV